MKEGMKSVILTLASIIFSGLTLVFFAVPNFYIGEGEYTLETSGFDGFDGGTDFMKAMLILTCIFVGLTILFGIAKILTDSKVISSKKASKFVNMIFVISAFIMVVCTVLYCISIGAMVNDTTLDFGSFGDLIGIGDVQTIKPTIWALVLMSVMSAIGFLAGLFSLNKKSGKRRK